MVDELTLQLAACDAELERIRTEWPSTQEPSRLHVLIVEDNQDDALLTVHVLRKELGPDVVIQWVGTLYAACRIAGNGSMDVVLLDLGLPGAVDPIQSIELLRKSAPCVPIVVVTGHPNPKLPTTEVMLGKPWKRGALAAAVLAAVEAKYTLAPAH